MHLSHLLYIQKHICVKFVPENILQVHELQVFAYSHQGSLHGGVAQGRAICEHS